MDVDTSKPNSGRIYDYLLGGHHNFEVDRAAADQLVQMIPSVRNAMRLNRWFMDLAVQRLAAAHFDCFLDLASGLPTEGYIHELMPTSQVLYNDRDPVTVAYSRQIIGENPHVAYSQSDIADIDTILQAAEAHFGEQRRVAVCLVGVSYFLDDAVLQRTLKALHTWCAPGSQVAISWIAMSDPPTPRTMQMLQLYQRMGAPIQSRTREKLETFVPPWSLMEPGFRTLADWNEVDSWILPEDSAEEGDMYGTFLIKD